MSVPLRPMLTGIYCFSSLIIIELLGLHFQQVVLP
uniref:Uncharacterized protein n=1 Tax=Anguilla anguilla TaxID=7936 RepID=A0A0E9PNK0_ANGAN